ncbi:hypothetical protein ACFWVB_38585 [Streptomyces microflavus]|uniref:hypothetical protein n=1 Tax=Streptomyces microflavus TaxID=1919 RepID=UPI0036648D08
MTTHSKEAIGLELKVDVLHDEDSAAWQLLLETKQGADWQLHQAVKVHPEVSNHLQGLHPDTLYRIRLTREGTGADLESWTFAADMIVAFRTPFSAARVLLTMIVHRTGYEVAACIDAC